MKSLFSQSGQVFPQFRVFGYLKTLFVPIIVLKITVSIPRFQWKDWFEKWTTLYLDICKKELNMARKTISQPHFVFSNISARGGPFLKPILHWNHGIETFVLSTIKGPKRVFKTPKKFPTSLKNCLKNQKLRENLTRLGKKAFHLGICDP